MGSVIGMADGSGESTASIKYDSFGNVTSAAGSMADASIAGGSDFRYHGMLLDPFTGLYSVRARTYDSRTGRFTSRDPIAGVAEEPETAHPYVFNRSCPHRWRDPSGLFMTELIVVAAVVTVLAAIAIPAYNKHVFEQKAANSKNECVDGWCRVASARVVHDDFDTHDSTEPQDWEFGHHWIELSSVPGQEEAYGWYPKAGTPLWTGNDLWENAVKGCEGQLNQGHAVDPHATSPWGGEDAAFYVYVPSTMSKIEFDTKVRTFARNYSGEWSVSRSCQTFMRDMQDEVGFRLVPVN